MTKGRAYYTIWVRTGAYSDLVVIEEVWSEAGEQRALKKARKGHPGCQCTVHNIVSAE